MKNLFLIISLLFSGITTQVVADSQYPAVHCACKRKNGSGYTMEDAECAKLCKEKGNWSGKAILSNSSSSITCICGDHQVIKQNASSVDCSGGYLNRGKCNRDTTWDGDFYSDKISEKNNMIHVDKSPNKKKDVTRKLYNKGFISTYED